MIVTYVYHSCCVIEFESFSLIVDFYKDPIMDGDEIGWVSKHLLKNEKPLYVLCTHSHADHFNEEILSWNRERKNITYVFSKEVGESLTGTFLLKDEKIVFLDRLEEYKDDNIRIKAFGSTDTGASFYIEHNDLKIFHAGDLNNWHWNEEVTKEEAYVYENHYICELELLSEEVKELDLVMFPLDPRLGKDFMRGGEQFVNKIKTDNFLPLHFGDNFDILKQFKPIASKVNTKLLELEHNGQSFRIK